MPEAKRRCEASLPPPLHPSAPGDLRSFPEPLLRARASFRKLELGLSAHPAATVTAHPQAGQDQVQHPPTPPPLGESVTSLPLLRLLPNGGDTAWHGPVLKVRLGDALMHAIPSSLPSSALPTGGVADLVT